MIVHEGRKYPTVEHAYQAAKTDDIEHQIQIQTAETPGIAKRMGRKYGPKPGTVLAQQWEKEKEGVMLSLLQQKFAQPWFRKQLLATSNAELVEGNTWNDTYWGVCGGAGKNRLGLLLMQVRTELQQKNP